MSVVRNDASDFLTHPFIVASDAMNCRPREEIGNEELGGLLVRLARPLPGSNRSPIQSVKLINVVGKKGMGRSRVAIAYCPRSA